MAMHFCKLRPYPQKVRDGRKKKPQTHNNTPGSCTAPGVLFYGEMIMMKEKRTV